MKTVENGGTAIGRRAVIISSACLVASWPTRPADASSVDGRRLTDQDILDGFAALSTAPMRFQDGRRFTLDGFRGRALLVNFWANWCVNCRAEFGSILQLQQAAGGPGQLAVVLVSQREFWQKDQSLARQIGLSFPLAMLDEPATSSGYEAMAALLLGSMVGGLPRYGLPVCYMVSRSGQVVLAGSGGMDWVGPLALSKAARALHS